MMETIVDWSDGMMIGGIGLGIAALILYLRQVMLVSRQIGRGKIDLATALRVGSARQDSYLAALWFGLFLVYTSQLWQQVQRGAPAQRIMFSMTSFAIGAFICGLFVGRLLMRRRGLLDAAAEPRKGEPLGKA
jgi:hypothetical protein